MVRGLTIPPDVLALADEVIERDSRAGFGTNMITLQDCVGLCGLTEEEVLAIAEHEHLPEIAATAFAAYLLSQKHGSEKVLDMIVDHPFLYKLHGARTDRSMGFKNGLFPDFLDDQVHVRGL